MQTEFLVSAAIGIGQLILMSIQIFWKPGSSTKKGKAKAQGGTPSLGERLRLRWPLIAMGFLTAIAWFPYLLRDKTPETFLRYVGLDTNVIATQRAGAPIEANIVIQNTGEVPAQSFDWKAAFLLQPEPVSSAAELQMFDDFRNAFSPDIERDLEAKEKKFITARTRPLSETDFAELQEGKLRLYMLIVAVYRDRNGPHEYQYCKKFQTAAETGTNELPVTYDCKSHNRTINR